MLITDLLNEITILFFPKIPWGLEIYESLNHFAPIL